MCVCVCVTRCGCRFISENESLVKMLSFNWETAGLQEMTGHCIQSHQAAQPIRVEDYYLCICGISGLFLNREEVLIPLLPVDFFFCGAWSTRAVLIRSH